MQRGHGGKYTRDQKAQALAITAQSNATAAGKQLGIPDSTVRRWVQHYTADGVNNWDDDNRDVIELATRMVMQGMEEIPEGETYRHLMALNAIRGTGIDKILKQTAPSETTSISVFMGVKVD